jgi:hypothetical protein
LYYLEHQSLSTFGEELIIDGLQQSPSGGICVRTTERGLPIAVKLDQRELSKAPQELASQILQLCQLAAMRAQVAHRRDLADRGVSSAAINGLKLSSVEELAHAQANLCGDDPDASPDTWMEPV